MKLLVQDYEVKNPSNSNKKNQRNRYWSDSDPSNQRNQWNHLCSSQKSWSSNSDLKEQRNRHGSGSSQKSWQGNSQRNSWRSPQKRSKPLKNCICSWHNCFHVQRGKRIHRYQKWHMSINKFFSTSCARVGSRWVILRIVNKNSWEC